MEMLASREDGIPGAGDTRGLMLSKEPWQYHTLLCIGNSLSQPAALEGKRLRSRRHERLFTPRLQLHLALRGRLDDTAASPLISASRVRRHGVMAYCWES